MAGCCAARRFGSASQVFPGRGPGLHPTRARRFDSVPEGHLTINALALGDGHSAFVPKGRLKSNSSRGSDEICEFQANGLAYWGYRPPPPNASGGVLGTLNRAFSALKVFGRQTQGDSPPTLRSGGLCPGLV